MSVPTYLLPDNLLPEDDFCARVYIPNDEGYRRAFLGAYTHLATWVAWQRDGNKSASIAARRFAESVEKTLDVWGSGCDSGCEMTIEEIREAIREELENMPITISNTNTACCCGQCGGASCGGASGGADLGVPSPPIVQPPDYVPPVPDPNPLNPSLAQKCNVAHYLVYTLRLTLLRAVENTENYTGFNAFIRSLWDGVKDAVDTWLSAISYEAYAWLMQNLNGRPYTLVVADVFDQLYNTLVCDLMSAGSQADAHGNVSRTLEGGIMINDSVRDAALTIANYLPYSLLFEETGAVSLPPGFSGRSCCGQSFDEVPPTPDLPDDSDEYHYELLPMTFDVIAFTNETNTYVTREDMISNGVAAGARIIRTGQYANATMTVQSIGYSREQLDVLYGVGGHDFVGYLFQVGDYTQVPVSPLCTIGISAGNNTLLPSTVPLAKNSQNLISVSTALGDELSNALAADGWTVQRKADPNFLVTGSVKPTINNTMTTPNSASYVAYDVTYRLLGGYQVMRVND